MQIIFANSKKENNEQENFRLRQFWQLTGNLKLKKLKTISEISVDRIY